MPISGLKKPTIVFGNKTDNNVPSPHLTVSTCRISSDMDKVYLDIVWQFAALNCFIVRFVLQGFAYVPRDDLVSLVANEFRVQLSRALAVGISCFFSMLRITNC